VQDLQCPDPVESRRHRTVW